MVFGNTRSEPQTFWMSKSGDYYDFGTSSPVVDDDEVSATFVKGQVSGIRYFVALNSLLAMTSDSEWVIGPGSSSSGAITPTNISTRPQSYRGCRKLEPVIVGNVVLFVQEQGNRVRSLGYDFSSDSFTGSDLTILANHLFRKHKIVSWAFQQEPDSMVWCVADDGSVCSLTFLMEHDVIAWARHPLGAGACAESVCCVKTAQGDEVYFVINRNGVRSVERILSMPVSDAASGVFLDGCVSVSAVSPVSSVSGLGHLNGLTVSALVDGNVEEGLVVSNGSVNLKFPGKVVHVGVPYTAEFETLDLALQRNDGSQMGRKARVSAVTVRVEDSRGVFAACSSSGKFEEFRERSTEDYDAPVRLFTGDFLFRLSSGFDSGRIVVSAPFPLPCSVLAVVPQVSPVESAR